MQGSCYQYFRQFLGMLLDNLGPEICLRGTRGAGTGAQNLIAERLLQKFRRRQRPVWRAGEISEPPVSRAVMWRAREISGRPRFDDFPINFEK